MTLRRLARMAEARQRDEWDRASPMMVLFFNANRGKDRDGNEVLAIESLQAFNPFRQDEIKSAPKDEAIFVPLKELKGALGRC